MHKKSVVATHTSVRLLSYITIRMRLLTSYTGLQLCSSH